jgi:ABC-type sugar transport system ATPase subunit
MAGVSIRNVTKTYGAGEGDPGHLDGHRRRRVRRHGRPSGCGKSTLLRMVAGLEEITSGEIAIGGRVVNKLEPKDRDIAMVFQNYALYPHMSVYDNMAYGLKIRQANQGGDRARVQRGGEDPRALAAAQAQAARALRRPAPARRHGARHRARAGGVPVRRAALQPRRQAARADAAGDPVPAPAPGPPRST